MTEELRFVSYQTPTFLNKSLKIGILAGLCCTPIGALWGRRGMISTFMTGTALGSIGAFAELNQMKHDYKFGKIASPPTVWNKELIIGGMEGAIAGNMLTPATTVGGKLFILSSAIGSAVVSGEREKQKMEIESMRAVAEKDFGLKKSLAGNEQIPFVKKIYTEKLPFENRTKGR